MRLTLAEDGLDDHSRDRRLLLPLSHDLVDLAQAPLLLLSVLLLVLLQRIPQLRERRRRPVERRDVELVDRLGAGGGEGAKQATVEGRGEGEDRESRRAGELVLHA